MEERQKNQFGNKRRIIKVKGGGRKGKKCNSRNSDKVIKVKDEIKMPKSTKKETREDTEKE